MTWSWWRVAVPMAAFGASLVLRIGDSDPWWHLAAGRWIAEHGAWPSTDPFSHTFAGQPWRYSEVLAQVLYAGAYGLAGAGGLSVLHVALGVLLAGVACGLVRGGTAATWLSVGLWSAASHPAMSAKPQMFSYLAFGVLCWVLRAAWEGRGRWLWTLPPMFLAWANLHRGGVLGLGAFAAAVLVWGARPDTRPLARRAALVLGMSTLASLCNTGGLYYWTSAFDVLGRSSFRASLSEWQPTTWALLAGPHAALIPLLVLALAARWRERPARVDVEVVLMVLTGVLAWRAARLLPFFGLALLPAAARAVDRALAGFAQRWPAPAPLVTALVALVGPAVLLRHHVEHVPIGYVGLGAMEQRVPVSLAAFVRAHPPPGRMWHSFDFGGYFVHSLAPAFPVFIDGRNDTVYDDAFFRDTLAAPNSPEVFAAQVARHGVGFAVVQWAGPNDPSFGFLHADPGWQLVYWDDLGAVMVRRTEASRSYLALHGYRELRVDSAFARSEALTDDAASARFVAELERNVRQAPHSLRALWLAAHALRMRDPSRAAAYAEHLGALAAQRGVPLPPP